VSVRADVYRVLLDHGPLTCAEIVRRLGTVNGTVVYDALGALEVRRVVVALRPGGRGPALWAVRVLAADREEWR
jgi:hypothetical protein